MQNKITIHIWAYIFYTRTEKGLQITS